MRQRRRRSVGRLWQGGKERGGSACVSTLVGTSSRAEISCDLLECAADCVLLPNKKDERKEIMYTWFDFLKKWSAINENLD